MPPAPPEIAPVISGDYPADLNGNRINDELEQGAGLKGGLAVAAAEEASVRVELVFSEPVTQAQIDTFLQLGGQITYLYQAISYGWNGVIPAAGLDLLPAAMGPTLVQVESSHKLQPYMDVATQTGRVRPIWKTGFAGGTAGFSGSSNTTIAFIGGGVDATHKDLSGRCVYWRDFSDDKETSPVDFDGHDSMVVGVAIGTGDAGGADSGELRYTYAASWGDYFHMAVPIWLPSGSVTMKSTATWTGLAATLLHNSWLRGTSGDAMKILGNFATGRSPQTLTNTFSTGSQTVLTVSLADFDLMSDLENVVITTSVTPYPGVGDGFNKFRGVAPGCKWAAAKVFDRDGYGDSDLFTAAMDEMVLRRKELKIKVMNISHGLEGFLGLPDESASLRDKVNSIVNNGIVVVAAAGNNASAPTELFRKMADPARAAQAITVGATNDENILTGFSSYGFFSPRKNSGEDFKPDLVAPGGSLYYSGIMSVDSGTSDGVNEDKEPDDYTSEYGTSFSAPFVAGCAALVIEAMEKQGATWSFDSADQPKYVKMLLCATASETNAQREGADKGFNPTLERTAGGPNAFPAGKDAYEGYGIINPDGAVEAVCQTYAPGAAVSAELGPNATNKRVWARRMNLKAGIDIDVTLDNPAGADFDIYLYSAVPDETGTPVLLASSTAASEGADESLQYTPTADRTTLLVVKRVSGSGTFSLRSIQAGPPVADDVQANGGINSPVTITLKATDDGRPNPPGALSYTIASLPKHGRLETAGGAAIAAVPAKLTNAADKVVFRPDVDWIGDDSFTFYAHDGGNAPFGGQSNTATVKITVVREITVEYQVSDGMDDAYCVKFGIQQSLDDSILLVGQYAAGMRFRNVKVPQGALVKSATLKIRSCSTGLTGQLDGVIYAEAANYAEDFSERKISQLTKTGASQPWVWGADAPWTASTWYESPNIANVVQEVVDRTGWKSDNPMVIVYWTTSYSGSDRKIWAYDGNPGHAAKLVITYQPK